MHRRYLAFPLALLLAPLPSTARQQPTTIDPNMPGIEHSEQQHPDHQHMPGMQMPAAMPMMKPASDLIGSILNHNSSGTTAEPPSTPMPMITSMRGPWMFMLHGNGFLADTQQTTSPASNVRDTRGTDKLFSTNWIMPMAMRQFGPAAHRSQSTLRAMFSLEPATISHRYYPELFQQGETAFGAPIIDGQHPHDFVMELAALYDLHLSEHTLLSLYAAPVGDPAIGPTAYPHRMSASEDPIAALGHHQQDSTHIAFNVLTGGLTWRWLRFEQSGFHGAEPTEAHWHFAPSPNGHALDSYSTRLTVTPHRNWTAQYSWAHITAPESLYPSEDQRRQTASVMYNHPFGRDLGNALRSGNLSATTVWGRTRAAGADHATSPTNSFLAEATLKFAASNYLWTRLENAGRSSELLLQPGSPLPPSFDEHPIGHVAAYTLGYDHDLHLAPHLLVAPGVQFTTYSTPATLQRIYGNHPNSVVAFLRFRINSQ